MLASSCLQRKYTGDSSENKVTYSFYKKDLTILKLEIYNHSGFVFEIYIDGKWQKAFSNKNKPDLYPVAISKVFSDFENPENHLGKNIFVLYQITPEGTREPLFALTPNPLLHDASDNKFLDYFKKNSRDIQSGDLNNCEEAFCQRADVKKSRQISKLEKELAQMAVVKIDDSKKSSATKKRDLIEEIKKYTDELDKHLTDFTPEHLIGFFELLQKSDSVNIQNYCIYNTVAEGVVDPSQKNCSIVKDNISLIYKIADLFEFTVNPELTKYRQLPN